MRSDHLSKHVKTHSNGKTTKSNGALNNSEPIAIRPIPRQELQDLPALEPRPEEVKNNESNGSAVVGVELPGVAVAVGPNQLSENEYFTGDATEHYLSDMSVAHEFVAVRMDGTQGTTILVAQNVNMAPQGV